MFCSLDMESDNIEEEESRLVINAVKDANIPKFIAEDIPLFKSILADLFPGVDPPGADNKLLKVSAVWYCCSCHHYRNYHHRHYHRRRHHSRCSRHHHQLHYRRRRDRRCPRYHYHPPYHRRHHHRRRRHHRYRLLRLHHQHQHQRHYHIIVIIFTMVLRYMW